MNPGATQHRDLVHIARLNKLGFDDQQQDDTLNSKGQRQAHKKALFFALGSPYIWDDIERCHSFRGRVIPSSKYHDEPI